MGPPSSKRCKFNNPFKIIVFKSKFDWTCDNKQCVGAAEVTSVMSTTTWVSGFLRCHHCNVHYCHKTATLGWTLGLCHWIRIWLHQVAILLVLSEIEAVRRTAIEPLIRVHSIHTDRQPPTTGDTDLWRSCWCRTCSLVSFKSILTSVVQKSSLYTDYMHINFNRDFKSVHDA